MKKIVFLFMLVMSMMSLTSYAQSNQMDDTGKWYVTLDGEDASIKPVRTNSTLYTIPNDVMVNRKQYFVNEADLSETSITTVYPKTFDNCKYLRSVKLPKTLTSIDGFYQLSTLEEVNFTELVNLEDIGSRAFYETGLKEVDLSNTKISSLSGENNFEGCEKLESVLLPSTITSIPYGMFEGCTNLESVNFGDLTELQFIGQAAFRKTAIKEVDLGNTKITTLVFGNFIDAPIETLVLPATITSIEDGAFGDAKFKTIDLSRLTSVPTIGQVFLSLLWGAIPEIKLSGLEMYNKFKAADYWGDEYVDKCYVFPIKVGITDAQYATFCSPRDLSFEGSDVKAYIATGYNAEKGKVTITAITEVPAGTGVILNCKTPGEYEITQKTVDTELQNMLVGTLSSEEVAKEDEEGNVNFVLGKKNDKVGFYPLGKDSYTMRPNKAYLPIPKTALPTSADNLTLAFEDETDSLTPVLSTSGEGSGYFSIDGRRLSGQPAQKGVYIRNGKKVVVK